MNIIKKISSSVSSLAYYILEKISPSKISSGKEIPIIINNFNRLTTLRLLITSLEKRGYKNIYILDNNSTYPPLLEFYNNCEHEVILLGRNLGFKALWKDKPTRKRFCCDYYIYTDSDVVLTDDCPNDVIEHLHNLLKNNYPLARKIGLSLIIDDIPEYFANKQKVLEWEKRFWSSPVNKDGLRLVPTDTTFALYRPRVGLSRSRSVESYRTDKPYSIKHLPWYQDSSNLTEEETYYINHCSHITAWTSKAKNHNS